MSSKFFIKIAGQPKQFPQLHVDYGKGYAFPWVEAFGAYAYAPKTQEEIDEIFASQRVFPVWTYVPHFEGDLGGIAPATVAAPVDDEAITELREEVARLNQNVQDAAAIIAGLKRQLAEAEKAKAATPAPAAPAEDSAEVAKLKAKLSDTTKAVAQLRKDNAKLEAKLAKASAPAKPPAPPASEPETETADV